MTVRMVKILDVLSATRPRNGMTANAIGMALGFSRGQEGHRTAKDGRVMGPANRVNFCLSRLRQLGFVDFGSRSDGLSGTSYYITDAGLAELDRHKGKAW